MVNSGSIPLYTTKINNMKITNKITGEDVTKYVLQYLEGKITKDQFEKLTGVTE